MFKTLFNVVTSTRKYEESSGFAGFGTFTEKEEGLTIPEDTTQALWQKRITNYTFARRYRVTREAYDDDQYGLIKRYTQALGRAARTTLEIDPATMINGGFSATSPSSTFTTSTGDAAALFSSAHTNYAGTNNHRNQPSTAASLSPASLQTALTDFKTQMLDFRGIPLMLTPKYLVVPPALEFTAKEILQSVLKPYTADNTKNVLTDYNLTLVVWNWLAFTSNTASTTRWYLFSDPADHGLTWQWRKPITDVAWDDEATFDAWYGAWYRRGLGCDTWQGLYGVNI